jgi:5,10-methylenetetrahydrofolate reductase
MAFLDRLKSVPLVFEVVPPHRRASAKFLEAFTERVRHAVGAIPELDALNLPEVIDENHIGRPFYRNLDPRRCVEMVNHTLPAETIVNKVVVHLEGAGAVEAWLRETLEQGFRNIVLAGGTSSHNDYPGPPVAAANALFRAVAGARPGLACGNITIPERPGEVARLLAKTRAGCDFFTTQVLFEPEPVTTVLREYGDACAAEGLDPAAVLLSFAPVADYADIEFLQWLGATVSDATEEALLADEANPGRASFDVARATWATVRDAMAGARHPVPLGANIEEISLHNFDLAVAMAAEFPRWRSARAPAR